MTLTREEVIEKAAHARGAREALEKLREWWVYSTPRPRECDVRDHIDDQLAALPRPGEMETKSSVTAEGTTGGLKRTKDVEAPRADLRQSAAPSTSAPLSDAETLEEAERVLAKHGWNPNCRTVMDLRSKAIDLRARSAPPAPDYADTIAHKYWAQPDSADGPSATQELAELIREWVGPCVQELEMIASADAYDYCDKENTGKWSEVLDNAFSSQKERAGKALARLRATAKEAK